MIALRRPEDYSLEQGARFEIHFEKLRNRADGAGGVPFEASLESFTADGRDGIRWCSRDLIPPILKRAAALLLKVLQFEKWRPSFASARVRQVASA